MKCPKCKTPMRVSKFGVYYCPLCQMRKQTSEENNARGKRTK